MVQRGYDDAYRNRARYGAVYNGNPSISAIVRYVERRLPL